MSKKDSIIYGRSLITSNLQHIYVSLLSYALWSMKKINKEPVLKYFALKKFLGTVATYNSVKINLYQNNKQYEFGLIAIHLTSNSQYRSCPIQSVLNIKNQFFYDFVYFLCQRICTCNLTKKNATLDFLDDGPIDI